MPLQLVLEVLEQQQMLLAVVELILFLAQLQLRVEAVAALAQEQALLAALVAVAVAIPRHKLGARELLGKVLQVALVAVHRLTGLAVAVALVLLG